MPSRYHHGNLRQALLDSAIQWISAEGVENLSLRALARDLGVSHAAPLRHFPTKADLLRELAEDGVTRLMKRTIKAQSKSAGRERLLNMSLAYVDWARKNPAYHHVLRNPDVMRHASPTLKQHLATFAKTQREEIEKAQGQGWRPGDDGDVLFLHLVSLTAGTALVVADPIYRIPMGSKVKRSDIEASLRLFLEMS